MHTLLDSGLLQRLYEPSDSHTPHRRRRLTRSGTRGTAVAAHPQREEGKEQQNKAPVLLGRARHLKSSRLQVLASQPVWRSDVCHLWLDPTPSFHHVTRGAALELDWSTPHKVSISQPACLLHRPAACGFTTSLPATTVLSHTERITLYGTHTAASHRANTPFTLLTIARSKPTATSRAPA